MTDFLKQLQSFPGWEEFVNWVYTTYSGYHSGDALNVGVAQKYFDRHFHRIPVSWQLTALVDWLDSKGVIIEMVFTAQGFAALVDNCGAGYYPTRNEALKAGILKGMELGED